MPRRSMWLLAILLIASVACHLRVHRRERVLAYALNEIERRALVKVSGEELFESAVEGMLSPLDDPHSTYISPKMETEFRRAINPEFVGVGIEILLDPETKQLMVATPLFGSPAFEAGIRPRDKILRIDDKSTQGMSVEDAALLIRGKPGTVVELTVQHSGEASRVPLRILRAKIQLDTVLGDHRNADGTWDFFLEGCDRIGYIHIGSFSENTNKEFERAVRDLSQRGARGLVLDLRNDPGGLLGEAVSICDMLLESGVIVTTRDRSGGIRQVFLARSNGLFTQVPIAVVVNGFSASASEIVAACLQDNQRAVVVGERTFGKGTVQELIKLPGGEGTLKLTTASYWRPSEKNINRRKGAGEQDEWGVSPNPGYEVKLTDDQLTRLMQWQRSVGVYRLSGTRPSMADQAAGAFPRLLVDVDPQLSKAVEYLKSTPADTSSTIAANGEK